MGPSIPSGPVGPRGPIAPLAPCGPVAPCAPVAPAAPVAPLGPGLPVDPVAPLHDLCLELAGAVAESVLRDRTSGGTHSGSADRKALARNRGDLILGRYYALIPAYTNDARYGRLERKIIS